MEERGGGGGGGFVFTRNTTIRSVAFLIRLWSLRFARERDIRLIATVYNKGVTYNAESS